MTNSNHQELEEARKDSPLEPTEGVRPCRHLDSRLQLQNYKRMHFYCFKPVVTFYCSYSQLRS